MMNREICYAIETNGTEYQCLNIDLTNLKLALNFFRDSRHVRMNEDRK